MAPFQCFASDKTSAIRFPLPNVWLGSSVENQATADARIPLLLQTPAAKRFVSYEPALGPVSFEHWTETGLECGNCAWLGVESQATEAGPEDDTGFACPKCNEMCAHTPLDELLGSGIDWIIVGGESGHGARPFDLQWAWNTIRQCKEAGVACFVKQFGSVPVMGENRWHEMVNSGPAPLLKASNAKYCHAGQVPLKLNDRKGGNIEEWPIDMQVREFPI